MYKCLKCVPMLDSCFPDEVISEARVSNQFQTLGDTEVSLPKLGTFSAVSQLWKTTFSNYWELGRFLHMDRKPCVSCFISKWQSLISVPGLWLMSILVTKGRAVRFLPGFCYTWKLPNSAWVQLFTFSEDYRATREEWGNPGDLIGDP